MKRILLLLLLLLPIFVLAQYPTFSNKQRLGVQTTGDGLIFRGTTINNIPNYTPSNVNNAYFHLDTVQNKLYLYNTNAWQLVYPTSQFDTTTLNVYLKLSDTTSMLLPYFRDSDTTSLNLINRFALKLNISDTATMLTPYMKKVDTISLSNRINLKLNISDTIILSNRITTNTNNIITINNKLATKLDTIFTKFKNVVTMIKNKDTINIGSSLTDGYAINIIGDSVNVDTTIIFTQSDTITLSNRINLKLNKSDTISLSNRINTKLDTIYVNYQNNLDTITNKDTINIIPLEAGTGINITNNVISLDTMLLDSVVRVQNVYVKNGTGTTLNKGEAVYVTGANGTNIIVGRASNVAESSSSKTLGLTMTSIAINGFGYVVKEGLLAELNTNAANTGDPIWLGVNGAVIYGLANKPYAPNHLVYLGVVTRKQQNNGEVYVTVQNGFEIKELHDVQIIEPVNKASLYYNSSQSLWRDTTAALLVSDTATMLNPYLRKLDTISLSNRIELRVKYADTTNMLLPYFRTNDTTLLNLNSRLSTKLNLSDTATMLSKYVNTYSNQVDINGNKTFNNVITIDSATVTGKLLVNTNISDAVKINSNTNSTNLELMNSGGSVFIKSGNKNMTLQTDTTALVYLKGDVNRVGILTMNPQQSLEVAGTIRVDSLINSLTPNKLVGANNSNDLTDVKLGTGLSFLNDTLKISDNIINSGDTATLLRKDYIVGSNGIVIWTEGNKKLIPYFTQVYRNGQLLKSNQYIITSDSIVTLNSDSYKIANIITIIAIDNIVALAGSGGVISLQGDVSGSGTNSITTTIGTSKVLNSMLSGGISNNKLDVITTAGKVSNSATTATNVNTINTIVSRDGSGNFSAGNITANNFLGNATSSTTATIANGVQSSISTGIIKLATSTNAVQPVITVPDVNATMATTNLVQTFSGTQTFSNTISGSINGNAATASNIAYSGLTGTVPTWNQNTTGTAATITGIYGNTITSSQVTSGLGFTPYNATNPNSYITSLSLTPYAPLVSPTFTGTVGGINKTMVGLGNVDNTSDASKPISTATQTALNLKQNTLSNASTEVNGILTAANFTIFNNKQSTLNGTGFVKASGTTISYDNSSFLPLTGGTLSGSLSVLDSISIGSLSQYTGRFTRYLKTSNISPYIDLFIGSVGTIGTWAGRMHFQTSYNTEVPTTAMTINEYGNINMNGTLGVTGATSLSSTLGVTGKTTISSIVANTISNTALLASASSPGYNNTNIGIRGVGQTVYSSGIGLQGEATQLDMNGYGSAFGVHSTVNGTGAGGNGTTYAGYFNNTTTVAGNNYGLYINTSSAGDYGIYQTGTGTNYFGSSITLANTNATPSTLLGKDGSNVVGTVTTVAQTGLFGRGSVTNVDTDANGNITVAHGFGFTPTMAFANLPGQTANAVNVKSIDGTNIVFVVRDGGTYNPLIVQTVTKIEFFAIK